MALEGTVVNGRVELDDPTKLADGTRVSVEPVEKFEYPHPMAPYDRDQEIALLRESIEDMKAGRGDSVEARAFLKQLAIERGLPLEPGE